MASSLAASFALLVLQIVASMAANQATDLCICEDLSWKPTPPHYFDVAHWHDKLLGELADAEKFGGYDVLFYGDSITMHWRDDWTDSVWHTKPPPPDALGRTPTTIFNATFRTKYTSDNMGVGSDTTANLWWRIINGELPLKFPPKVAVIAIGTNDLGFIEGCKMTPSALEDVLPGTKSRMRHLVAYIRNKSPTTHVLIVGVLPRGSWSLPQGKPEDWPTEQWAWPNRMTAAINDFNSACQIFGIEDSMVHYLDCGGEFVIPANNTVDRSLLPDNLHPNTEGYARLAKCMGPVVDALVAAGPCKNATALIDVKDSYNTTCDGYSGETWSSLAATIRAGHRPDR